MVMINLLPWRQARDTYQTKKLNKIIISTTLVGLLIVIVAHCFLQQKQADLQMRIDELSQQTHQLASLQPMLQDTLSGAAKETLMRQLLVHQHFVADLFNAIPLSSTDALCFSAITHQRHHIIFLGKAHSMHDLKSFFLAWRAARLFSQIKIEQLVQKRNHSIQFRLQADEMNAV